MSKEIVEREKRFRFQPTEEEGGMSMKVAAINKADDIGDRFLPNAFKHNEGKTVPVLPNHRMSENPPLGVAKNTGESDSHALADIAFNSTSLAQEWRKAAMDHGIEASVRVKMKRQNIEVREDGGWDISKADIVEISLTPMGLQPGTGVVGKVKSEGNEENLDPEDRVEKKTFRLEKSLAKSDLARRRLSALRT